jgi:amidase
MRSALLFAALALSPLAIGNGAQASGSAIETDLNEVTIPRLESLYSSHKYTVTQVTRWYLDRIAHYNDVYNAFVRVDRDGALATAKAEDTAADSKRGALWGVPIVIKTNTSIEGLVTTDGWKGYVIPGHELVAPRDATVVAKLRAAGAVILGQTTMPDFAGGDTTISSLTGRTGNAYNWRFSPGGSSGGTVTSVAANFAVFGTGTDTGNSIRMPAGTSSVVGVLPTRGLVSIAGIHPLDWLLDDTGPIARTVTDAAIALDVMAGEDPLDFRTKDSGAKAERGPYTKYLKKDALKGRRFGVPAFIITDADVPMRPETRALFLKAIEELRHAGATVEVDDAILPASFVALIRAVRTGTYRREGFDAFLRDFGPQEYHSVAEYAAHVQAAPGVFAASGPRAASQKTLETDPDADKNFWAPQRAALAAYTDTLDRLHLDGFVYPSAQMPPNDETIPGKPSSGPHSDTAWINPIGVPAVVVPGGFYDDGLPFGLEISARRWKDGDLLGWTYAYEQSTSHRKPPVLVDKR